MKYLFYPYLNTPSFYCPRSSLSLLPIATTSDQLLSVSQDHTARPTDTSAGTDAIILLL